MLSYVSWGRNVIQCAISTSSERTSIETPDGTQRFTKSHDKIKKLYTSVLLENLQYNGGVESAADEVAVPQPVRLL